MQFCTKTNRNRTLRGKRNSLPPKLQRSSKNHEAVQPVGAAKQDPILLHEAESWLPMLVFLMVTQKTNTTKSTIKAYSTSPWPSSSTNSLFKSSTYLTPFLLKVGTRRVVVSFPLSYPSGHYDCTAFEHELCHGRVSMNFYIYECALNFSKGTLTQLTRFFAKNVTNVKVGRDKITGLVMPMPHTYGCDRR